MKSAFWVNVAWMKSAFWVNVAWMKSAFWVNVAWMKSAFWVNVAWRKSAFWVNVAWRKSAFWVKVIPRKSDSGKTNLLKSNVPDVLLTIESSSCRNFSLSLLGSLECIKQTGTPSKDGAG